MKPTNRARKLGLTHRCSYECDCDEWRELPFEDFSPGDLPYDPPRVQRRLSLAPAIVMSAIAWMVALAMACLWRAW